jgi:hypothetical protein
VFGADEYNQLSHDEQMRVAMMGRAVSPVTSYVAFEPGTRPSTIGIEEGEGRGGFGMAGYGAGGGGMGYAASGARPRPGDLVDVDRCVKLVHPKDAWSVDFTVETTKDEIVDVATKDTAAMAACLVESVWNVRLDSRFDLDRESFAFTLRGPAAP